MTTTQGLDAFKAAMEQPLKQISLELVVDTEPPQTFTQQEIISANFTSSGTMFSAAATAFTVKLAGTGYDLVDKSFNATLSVTTSEAGGGSFQLGRFYVCEQTIDLESRATTIKGFDAIGKLTLTNYDNALTYPTTVGEMLRQIATKFDLELVDDVTTFPNFDRPIEQEIYSKSNTSYRVILSELAGALGCLIRLEPWNKLRLIRPNTPKVDTLGYDHLTTIKLQPEQKPVDTIVLSRVPQEDNIVLSDEDLPEGQPPSEVKLANNTIIDQDRPSFARPLLDAIKGFSYYPFEAKTDGRGWYRVGDRLELTDGVKVWAVLISEIVLNIAQGFSETLKGAPRSSSQTDYSKAGGITRTIYNTEIKVDKQKQEILSIVGRQDEIDGEVKENYTKVTQNITNVSTSIQNIGGSNLIRNSAGFLTTEKGLPLYWSYTEAEPVVTAKHSDRAVTLGSVSGHIITLQSGSMWQRVAVAAGQTYSFSIRVRKPLGAVFACQLSDGVETHTLMLDKTEVLYYQLQSIPAIVPRNNYLDLAISIVENTTDGCDFTDAMLNAGDTAIRWAQGADEFSNTEISLDKSGVIVRSSEAPDLFTVHKPTRFIGAQGSRESFSIDSDAVRTKAAELTDSIALPPLQIVPMYGGWGVIKSSSYNQRTVELGTATTSASLEGDLGNFEQPTTEEGGEE